MSLLAAVLEIGTVAVKHMLKIWLGPSSQEYDISSSLVDILKVKTDDIIVQRAGERQLEAIGDQIGASLLPFFEREGDLDEGDRIAIALAVKDAFNQAKISSEIIVQRNLEPSRLAQYVRDVSPSATRDFSEVARELYLRIIQETCTFIVDIASQLPSFTERSFAEILKRGDQLTSIAREILEDLRKMREDLDPMIEAERFEIEYRQAVVRNLDILQLIGADVSLPNRRHRLSVAYITLSVQQKQASNLQATNVGKQKQEEIKEIVFVNTALAHSHRILIRGQAGSGKTTLLQWIAVQAATKSFDGELAGWNSFIPFYIRLRTFALTGLPSPEKFPRLIALAISDTMPRGWVHNILRAGRALVLIDGVDEIPASQREEVHTWLNDLVESYTGACFIVTSRPHAIQAGWMNHHAFHDAELQPMELSNIYTFIDHWHRAVGAELQTEEEKKELKPLSDHLKGQVKLHHPLRLLATNPLLCAMLCALNRDRRRHLPVNRIELYRACCELLLERREKESRIDLSDYPALNLAQKERLLQDLAYWMLQNNLPVADILQVDERFTEQLANMPGTLSGAAVRRLFVERSGIIREPAVGQLDFTHFTFEEYFAAQAALQESEIEQLVARAHLDQWREVIVLTAGLASKSKSEQIIAGLLKRGDAEQANRHALHLLAVSCLENVIQLRPEMRMEVEKRLMRLVPPKNLTEAKAVSAAGDLVAKYLKRKGKMSATVSVACVQALTFIGSDTALDVLETYIDDTREEVRRELLKAWDTFDRKTFTRHILARIPSLKFDHLASLDGLEFASGLVSLDLSGCDQLADLSPLANLSNLTSLDLSGCSRLADLSPLANLSSLTSLDLSGCSRLADLSPLANLSSLTSLDLSGCNLLADLSPLANLSSLAFLDLSGCYQLTTLTLKDLSTLTSLNLSRCYQLSVLTLVDLGKLTTLNLYRCDQLSTLTLAGMRGLATLDLSGSSQLKTLTLTDLGKLTSLDLSSCKQVSTVTLTDLREVTSLDLSGSSQLKTLTLTGLGELTSLNLSSCNQLGALSFTDLGSLTSLDLSRCSRLTDLSLVANLGSLTSLDLSGCSRLTDLSPLAALGNLASLGLSKCYLLTEATIRGLPSLTSLDLSGCYRLSELNLVGLNSLTLLNVSKCDQLIDLNSLADLSSLTSLDLSGCYRLTDFSSLARLCNLHSLSLSGCVQLNDLNSIADLSSLATLDLSRCYQLTTITLAGLQSLTSLDLSGCNRMIILKLNDLTSLSSLNLSGCEQLTTLSLTGISNLTLLNLHGCSQMTDLSPLDKLSHLKIHR